MMIFLLCRLVAVGSDQTPSANEVERPVIGPPGEKDLGRIIRLERENAVVEFQGQSEVIKSMVQSGILSLTKSDSLKSGWEKIAAPGERVGVFIAPDGWSDNSTLAPIVESLIQGLQSSGISKDQIFLWSRNPNDLSFLKSELQGILDPKSFLYAVNGGYDSEQTYESPVKGTLIWSDVEFGSEEPSAGRLSYVSKLLINRFDRVIQVGSLASDRVAGIRGHLYSLAYSGVGNFNRFLTHPAILAEAVPEIYALEPLADKTCLFITDALIGSVVGNRPGKIHYHPPVSELWISRDPVALDAYTLKRANELRESIGFNPFPESAGELIYNAELMELGQSTIPNFRIELVP